MDSIALAPPSNTPSVAPEKPGDGIGSASKEWKPLYQHFGIEQETQRHDDALSKIWNWAKNNAESKDKDSIIFEVIKLNHKLGSPSLSNKPYSKLENYIGVVQRYKQAEEQLKELEK